MVSVDILGQDGEGKMRARRQRSKCPALNSTRLPNTHKKIHRFELVWLSRYFIDSPGGLQSALRALKVQKQSKGKN